MLKQRIGDIRGRRKAKHDVLSSDSSTQQDDVNLTLKYLKKKRPSYNSQ